MSAFAWQAPRVSGKIRTAPEDFSVTEQLGYDASGSGEHLWLWVEKRQANTVDVARDLARLAGVHPRQVSFAGLKDRNAVTRQPFTIHLPGKPDPDWASWPDDSFRILSASRHQRKIQRGRLAGNQFELIIRDLTADDPSIDVFEELSHRLKQIQVEGVPNGFGEQRFGGNNIQRARALFAGELKRKPSRVKQGFYLSAARSLIFNQVLSRRIERGDWNALIDGDVAMLDGSRSIFVADAEDADQKARCAAMDLHPTGPMVGVDTEFARTTAGQIEQAVIQQHQDLFDGLVRFGLKAERRSLRMRPEHLEWTFLDTSTLRLHFSLPRGSYATSLLRELIEYTDASKPNEA